MDDVGNDPPNEDQPDRDRGSSDPPPVPDVPGPHSEWPPTAWSAPAPADPSAQAQPAYTWALPEVPDPPAPPPRRGRKVVAAILAALLLLSGGIGIGWVISRHDSATNPITTEEPLQPLSPGSSSGSEGTFDPAAIADKVDPGVVDINTVIGSFAGSGGQPAARAAGTGMVLTSSGEILTNNHVIAGATSISVEIAGHSGMFTATVIGADPKDDVALIQIQGVSGLQTVTLTKSSSVRVGQRVVAIGNALGQGGTPKASAGTVTALGRGINIRKDTGGLGHLEDLIQFSAQISPGESGGPLVNASGQVVGMITAAATVRPNQRVSAQGFAIPVDTAVGIVNQIRSGQATEGIYIGQTGFLGVGVRNLESADAIQIHLDVSTGALVVEVVPGTPAAKAGITTNSVITKVDGEAINSADELGPHIYAHKPGDQIAVTWVDESGVHTATVTLIAGPAV